MEEQSKKRLISQKIFIFLLFIICGVGVFFFADKYRDANSELSSEKEINAALYPDDGNPSAIAARADYKYDSKLKMTGSAGFKRHITRALELIWIYDRSAFKFIRENIYEIKSANSTTFVFENGIPCVFISDRNAYKSLTWCAGIISHHAFHAYARRLKNRDKKKKTVPPLPGKKRHEFRVNFMDMNYTDLDTVIAIENKASDFQMRVLKKIGAPKSEIRYIKNRDPKDFSISHDGAYSVNP